MVAIGVHHPLELGLDERITGRVRAGLHVGLRPFGLNHNAFNVRRGKRRLGRAP